MINQTEEVNFKDIFKRLQQVIKFLISKWLIILISWIIGGLLGLFYAIQSKPNFNATLNFVLSTSSSGNNMFGLASQFGFNLGGDNDNMFSGDNIIALMQSRRMVQEALFKKPAESNEPLINIFVRDNKINEGWQKNARTKNAYPFPAVATKMTMVQDSLARAVYKSIASNMLNVSKPDDSKSIYTVTTTSKDQFFAYYLTTYLVDVTSAFYIDTKTSTAKRNLNMLQHEADSLRNALGGAITSAGSQTDLTFNLNPAYQVQRSGAQQNQAKAAALSQAYGQVLQNLELAKITLQKEMPLYQIIDKPTLPLEAEIPGKRTSLILGGFIVAFLACTLLLLVKFYKTFNT